MNRVNQTVGPQPPVKGGRKTELVPGAALESDPAIADRDNSKLPTQRAKVAMAYCRRLTGSLRPNRSDDNRRSRETIGRYGGKRARPHARFPSGVSIVWQSQVVSSAAHRCSSAGLAPILDSSFAARRLQSSLRKLFAAQSHNLSESLRQLPLQPAKATTAASRAPTTILR